MWSLSGTRGRLGDRGSHQDLSQMFLLPCYGWRIHAMLPCSMPMLDLLPLPLPLYNRCPNLPSRQSLSPSLFSLLDLLIGEEGGEPDWFPPSRYVWETCYWGVHPTLTL